MEWAFGLSRTVAEEATFGVDYEAIQAAIVEINGATDPAEKRRLIHEIVKQQVERRRALNVASVTDEGLGLNLSQYAAKACDVERAAELMMPPSLRARLGDGLPGLGNLAGGQALWGRVGS